MSGRTSEARRIVIQPRSCLQQSPVQCRNSKNPSKSHTRSENITISQNLKNLTPPKKPSLLPKHKTQAAIELPHLRLLQGHTAPVMAK